MEKPFVSTAPWEKPQTRRKKNINFPEKYTKTSKWGTPPALLPGTALMGLASALKSKLDGLFSSSTQNK